MNPPDNKNDALQRLARSFIVREQLQLREQVEKGPDYYRDVLGTYLQNPFLRLTADELEVVPRVRPEALGQLIAARDAATRSTAPKHVVFCMPKSGSSFLMSALQHALQLPFVSLTSFGPQNQASYFGMNGREQELDEMAVTRAILTSADGFVAQHHTRYTFYLGLQSKLFGLSPIVSVRNVFDCIVSFDDMMMAWRRGKNHEAWISDAQFALPANYTDLPREERYRLLAPSFGVWLINFYLSWTRGRRQGVVAPLIVRYEDHVLAPERLVETLADHIEMTDDQRARLRDFAHRPDPQRARLNVGRRGRGLELIPEAVRSFLADYARMFRGELSDHDLDYLVAAAPAG